MLPVTTWTPDAVAAAAERFAAALAQADPDAAVPACPGWTVTDLVTHLGNVHTWAAAIVMSASPVEAPDGRPGDTALDEWYAARAVHLVGVLADADPDAACWNFAGVHETAGFWSRRQLHETLMHLVDLDQAHGRPTPLEPATCADGVTETLEVFVPRLHARGHVADLVEPVSFRATDTGDAWTLHPDPGSHSRLTRGLSGGASEHLVAGTAEQLWLRLWNRGGQVMGSGEVVDRLLASRLSA